MIVSVAAASLWTVCALNNSTLCSWIDVTSHHIISQDFGSGGGTPMSQSASNSSDERPDGVENGNNENISRKVENDIRSEVRRLRAEAAALGREHASLAAQHAALVLEKARQVIIYSPPYPCINRVNGRLHWCNRTCHYSRYRWSTTPQYILAFCAIDWVFDPLQQRRGVQ